TTIGIIFAWQIVVTPLLLPIKALGSSREGLLGAATDRLKPSGLLNQPTTEIAMTIAVAAVVIVAWAILPLALGAWRTATRDAYHGRLLAAPDDEAVGHRRLRAERVGDANREAKATRSPSRARDETGRSVERESGRKRARDKCPVSIADAAARNEP